MHRCGKTLRCSKLESPMQSDRWAARTEHAKISDFAASLVSYMPLAKIFKNHRDLTTRHKNSRSRRRKLRKQPLRAVAATTGARARPRSGRCRALLPACSRVLAANAACSASPLAMSPQVREEHCRHARSQIFGLEKLRSLAVTF